MFPSKSPKPWRMVTGASAALLVVVLASGCGDTYPADMNYGVRTDLIVKSTPSEAKSFGHPGQWPYLLPDFQTEGGTLYNPNDFSAELRSQFDKTLTDLFGTPAAPKVARVGSLEQSDLDTLRVDEKTLAEGSKHYRRHCLHCHGLTGDGHGPTAAWVNPHPRDYRLGKFKYTSSDQNDGSRKPRREDLMRVLRQGLEGTSMPSFGLLPENELQALISYVIHLSLRGQSELKTMDRYYKGRKDTEPADIKSWVERNLVEAVGFWLNAEQSLINPISAPNVLPGTVPGKPRNQEEEAKLVELDASIKNGYQQFLGASGGTSCISCHLDFGRRQSLLYDAWGTVVRPADLTSNIYRGGRRPIDLYWRIHSGVNGAGMPSFPGEDIQVDKLEGWINKLVGRIKQRAREKNMWDIINFVLALPYPDRLPLEIRDEIYPAYKKSSQTASRD